MVATQVLSTDGSGGFRWPCGWCPRCKHPRGGTTRAGLQVELKLLNGQAWGLQLEDVQVDVQKFAEKVSASLCLWTQSSTVACSC